MINFSVYLNRRVFVMIIFVQDLDAVSQLICMSDDLFLHEKLKLRFALYNITV